MKISIRFLCALICILLIAVMIFGCTKEQPEKVFDLNQDPALYVEHFDRFTALYGTERMEAINSLGYELSDLTFEHGFHFELPLEAQINGVSFDVSIDFDSEAKLCQTTYTKTYSYSTEKELAVEQIMETCKYLADSLGEPDLVDYWNDVLEERSGLEQDSSVPIYRSEAQLTKLFDDESGGGIMFWDIRGYSDAFDSYYAYRESVGWYTIATGFSVSADCDDGVITFAISY